MLTPENQAVPPGMGTDAHRSFVRRQARPGWAAINFKELWNYRELLVFYAIRDIKVRYKQTILGAAWAILQPFMTMVVFSIFFGKLAGMPTDGLPYPAFFFCGLLPWQLFAFALTQSSNSLVQNAHLLTKVYFPRLIIPFSSVIVGLIDFVIAFIVLLGIMLYYDIIPGWALITLPFFVVLAITAALSAGLWLSALNAKYRDVRFTIPFLAQFWLFVTPVAYSSSLVPSTWQTVYAINPMVGVVEGFRWALLGGTAPPGAMLIVSVVATAILFAGGLLYFAQMEKTFPDII
jgi:lipopolysaccharide transport system permease protein